MIFASFGNSPVPFIRMAVALDNFAASCVEEVVVQSGYTDYKFMNCRSVDFMDKEIFFQNLRECSVAILQGGWGSISEASNLGVRVVTFPRRKGVEHYHDQEQLIKALEARSICLGCYDEKDLPKLIEKARTYEFKPIKRGSAAKEINDFLASF